MRAQEDMLYSFWMAISRDPRITMRHIGLYAALVCLRRHRGAAEPLCLYAREVMEAAKLFAQCTYHQYIKQLDEYGYLRYEPSFKKNQPSKIYLLPENFRKVRSTG